MSKAGAARHKKTILEGHVLAVDPSSGSFNKRKEQSNIGYAIYKAGELTESGIVELNGQDFSIFERLKQISECFRNDFETPDLLVIERIRGSHCHVYLKWSVAVIGAAIAAPVEEMNVSTWKSLVDADYVKSDRADAEAIGMAMIKLARGL